MVTVAIARELTGFMWAMAKEVPLVAEDEVGSSWHAALKIVHLGKGSKVHRKRRSPGVVSSSAA